MDTQADFQRITAQLQQQRNQFADAHAVAAARVDALAEENARLKTDVAKLTARGEEYVRDKQQLQAEIDDKDYDLVRADARIVELEGQLAAARAGDI